MFVYSVKASTLKFLASALAAVAIFVCLAVFIPTQGTVAVFADDGKIVYTEAKTNEGRVNFLNLFGWQVDSNPVQEAKVTVPSEFDTVFAGYNELQKMQGLDLSKYKRKEVTRYTYKVTNYPDYSGTVYANLIIYRGRVIGGDICTESSDGFIHGFSKNVRLG